MLSRSNTQQSESCKGIGRFIHKYLGVVRVWPGITGNRTKTSLTAPTLAWDGGHKYAVCIGFSMEYDENRNNIMELSHSPSIAVVDGMPIIAGITHTRHAPFAGIPYCERQISLIFSTLFHGPFLNVVAIR